MTVSLSDLKKRAMRLGMMIKHDRRTSIYNVNTIGRASAVYQSDDLARVGEFLKRRAKTQRKATDGY